MRNVDVDVDEYQGEPEYVAERKAKAAAEQVEGPILVRVYLTRLY